MADSGRGKGKNRLMLRIEKNYINISESQLNSRQLVGFKDEKNVTMVNNN